MESQTLESMLVCTKPQQAEKKAKPQTEHALKCPRCDSSNTKFCYYNNYSLTQPRYFCKSCRRYWTQGGTLRNVPVGGGCRKNKRSSSSSSSSSNASKIRTNIENQLDHHHNQSQLCHLPPVTYDHHHHHPSHDLALALAKFQKQSNGQMGFDDHDQISNTHMGIHLGNQMDQSSLFHYGEMGYQLGGLGGSAAGIMGLNIGDQEMTIPFEELSGGAAGSNGIRDQLGENIGHHENHMMNRSVLWGFPWQFGDGNNSSTASMGLDHIDHPRSGSTWNGIGSTWHGLLNSPLM